MYLDYSYIHTTSRVHATSSIAPPEGTTSTHTYVYLHTSSSYISTPGYTQRGTKLLYRVCNIPPTNWSYSPSIQGTCYRTSKCIITCQIIITSRTHSRVQYQR